mmetsp:Transcript_5999/g.37221  ORF Transcript_5999/g.37221 Transcript_5999/m.37221 type:complete len:103 (+) Transcript_5999:830-1138(+)
MSHSCTIVLFRVQLCPVAVLRCSRSGAAIHSYLPRHRELAAAVRLCRMALSPATRVTLGAVLGGLVGFYVVDRLEDDYRAKRKEKFREEVVKQKEKIKADHQ